MNDTTNDTPEIAGAESPQKPKPPLPPPAGRGPAPGATVAARPLPVYDPGPAPPKSPPLAAFLAVLIPGLGHLYTWAYERAFMIWATIAVCVFLIVNDLWGFSFLIAFVYFFSIFDAYREAQFFNLRAEEEDPNPRPDGQGRLMFGVFLAVVAAVVLYRYGTSSTWTGSTSGGRFPSSCSGSTSSSRPFSTREKPATKQDPSATGTNVNPIFSEEDDPGGDAGVGLFDPRWSNWPPL